MTYQEQLQDPRWHEIREVVKLRDLNKCTECESRTSLQVHHTYYKTELKAWEYPLDSLKTLCKKCHSNKHIVEENPFIDKLKISARNFNGILLEDDIPTKFYFSHGNLDKILALKEIELKLLLYISNNIEVDKFKVNETYLVRKLKLKNKRDLRLIIDSLVKNEFIYPDIDHVYWINPHIMFCGNRVKKYPKSVIVR